MSISAYFVSGPRNGQPFQGLAGCGSIAVYRPKLGPIRAFDWGADGEEDPSRLGPLPVEVGFYRQFGNLLVWEGWESETANEEVQDHDRE
jgi:hypothetical protein